MTKSRPSSRQTPPRVRKPHKRSVQERSASSRSITKTASLLALLSKPEGVSVMAMSRASGWQVHSIRGFLAGHVRKKLGLEVSSEKSSDGIRLYRIIRG
jgi:Protein of unknown function (DUF3489)